MYKQNFTTQIQEDGTKIDQYQLDLKDDYKSNYSTDDRDSPKNKINDKDNESLNIDGKFNIDGKSLNGKLSKSKQIQKKKPSVIKNFKKIKKNIAKHPFRFSAASFSMLIIGFFTKQQLQKKKQKAERIKKDNWTKFQGFLNKKDLIKELINQNIPKLIPLTDKEVLKFNLLTELSKGSSDVENLKKQIDANVNPMDDSVEALIQYVQHLIQNEIKIQEDPLKKAINNHKDKDPAKSVFTEKVDDWIKVIVDVCQSNDQLNIEKFQNKIFQYSKEIFEKQKKTIEESINQEQEAIKLKNQQNQQKTGAPQNSSQQASQIPPAQNQDSTDANQAEEAEAAKGEEAPKESSQAEGGVTDPKGGIAEDQKTEETLDNEAKLILLNKNNKAIKIQRVYRAYKEKISNQAKKKESLEGDPKAEEAEIPKTEEESQQNSEDNILKDQLQKALKEQILQSINKAQGIVGNQNSNLEDLSNLLDLLPEKLKEDSFESEEKKQLDDLLKRGIQQIFTKTKEEIMKQEKLLEEKDREILNLDTQEIALFKAINQSLSSEASENEVSLTEEEQKIKDQLQRIKQIVQKKKESDKSARDLYERGKELLKQGLELEEKIKSERYQAVDIKQEIVQLNDNNKNLTEKRQARKQEQIKLSLAQLNILYNEIIRKSEKINKQLSEQSQQLNKKKLEYLKIKIELLSDSDIRNLYAVELEKNNQRDDLDILDFLRIKFQKLQTSNQELIEGKLKEIYEKEMKELNEKPVSEEGIEDANEDSEILSSDGDENQDDKLNEDEEKAGEVKVGEVLNSSQVENIVSEEDSQHQRRADEEEDQAEASEEAPEASGDDQESQHEVRKDEEASQHEARGDEEVFLDSLKVKNIVSVDGQAVEEKVEDENDISFVFDESFDDEKTVLGKDNLVTEEQVVSSVVGEYPALNDAHEELIPEEATSLEDKTLRTSENVEAPKVPKPEEKELTQEEKSKAKLIKFIQDNNMYDIIPINSITFNEAEDFKTQFNQYIEKIINNFFRIDEKRELLEQLETTIINLTKDKSFYLNATNKIKEKRDDINSTNIALINEKQNQIEQTLDLLLKNNREILIDKIFNNDETLSIEEQKLRFEEEYMQTLIFQKINTIILLLSKNEIYNIINQIYILSKDTPNKVSYKIFNDNLQFSTIGDAGNFKITDNTNSTTIEIKRSKENDNQAELDTEAFKKIFNQLNQLTFQLKFPSPNTIQHEEIKDFLRNLNSLIQYLKTDLDITNERITGLIEIYSQWQKNLNQKEEQNSLLKYLVDRNSKISAAITKSKISEAIKTLFEKKVETVNRANTQNRKTSK